VQFDLVYDRQPNQGAAAATDIFDTGGSNSFQKAETYDRFVVLHSERWQLNGSGAGDTVTSATAHNVEWSIPLSLPSYFVNSGNNIITGALILVYRSSAAFYIPDNAEFNGSYRLWFRDE